LNTICTQSPAPDENLPWGRQEIIDQIAHSQNIAKQLTKSSGQAHYAWSALRAAARGGPPAVNNVGDVLSAAGSNLYETPALLPPCRSDELQGMPTLDIMPAQVKARWSHTSKDVRYWAVWTHANGKWGTMQILPQKTKELPLDGLDGVAVRAVDKFDRVSPVNFK
jgi:hypothetical protein